MRIEQDIKLDFCDVLLRPKRSTLESRSDVDLYRSFKFKHSKQSWKGVPIIASNMDGVGEWGVNEVLNPRDWLTCLTKTAELKTDAVLWHHLMYNAIPSVGFCDNLRDLDTWGYNFYDWICLDVPNGYIEKFLKYVTQVREKYPEKTIIAGNVVSKEMTEALILAGADVVKVGIGCFTENMMVKSYVGLAPIGTLTVGTLVLTHKGRWRRVTKVWKHRNTKQLLRINDICCTEDHLFYVVEKRYKELVNEQTLELYAKWLPANQITKNHLLVRRDSSEHAEMPTLRKNE